MNSCSPQSCVFLPCLLFTGGKEGGEICHACHCRDFSLCAVSDEESTSFWDGQLVASPWLFVRPFVLKEDSKAVSELRLGLLILPWQLEMDPSFLPFSDSFESSISICAIY